MDIRRGIDDGGLRKLFGLQTFSQGSDLASKGAVSAPRDVYPGIAVYVVSDPDGRDYAVLRRLHTDKVDLLDCDCPDEKCRHIVAVLTHPKKKPDVVKRNDPELIKELEAVIERIAEDIVEDPEYDEDANGYEDWEKDRYDIEDCNDHVEYRHVRRVLERIVCEVADPDAALMLIDGLLSNLSELEYNNGGADSAFTEREADVCILFTRAKPKTIAKVLGNRCNVAERLYKKCMVHVPSERQDLVYQHLDKSSKLSDYALEMQFERGDYDAYIRCSPRTIDAIFRVVEHLDAEHDESASKYAGMLAKCKDSHRMDKAAGILVAHGYREEAAKLYLKMFKESHEFADFDNVRKNSVKIDTEKLLDDLADETLDEKTYDNEALKTLVLAGRASDVDRYIRKVGFVPPRDYKDYDCRNIPDISRALIFRGFGESAAIVGRGLILLRLTVKNPDRYGDAVEMMKIMDQDKRYEALDPPHSVFRTHLRAEYSRLHKFWGLYSGTWHRSGDRWNPASFRGGRTEKERSFRTASSGTADRRSCP